MSNNLTGYPSIDKPWLKYYSEEAIHMPLPEKTMYQYIYDNNENRKDNYALNYFGRRITYGELFENIDKAAKAFEAIGVKKGDTVTIMSMHTPEIIYCLYALNRIGAIANMVYLTLAEQEILANVKKTESKTLVVLSIVLEKIEKIRDELELDKVIVVSPADSMNIGMKLGYNIKTKSPKLSDKYLAYKEFVKCGKDIDKFQDADYEKNRTAVIVYTSGSTGEPKGVVLSNDNLNAVAHQYMHSGMEFERGDSIFNMLPPYLGFGISIGMHLGISLGMEEILWIQPDPIKVADAFIKYKPNHFISAPVVVEEITKRLVDDLSFLKTFSVGGESPKAESVRALNEIFEQGGSKAKYILGYGLTETSAAMCAQKNDVNRLGSLGIPIIKAIVKIVDTETGKELKYNEIGEMWFASPNVMQEYYQNPQATSEIISTDIDGVRWLHSGDLGMVDEDGFVYHKGRIKRIYMTMVAGGEVYKLFPALVEEKFVTNPKVKSCGTIAIPDEERLHVLVSYVTMKDKDGNKEQLITELMECAQAEFPEHSVPVKIVVLDEMPLTQSGKVDYQRLEKIV